MLGTTQKAELDMYGRIQRGAKATRKIRPIMNASNQTKIRTESGLRRRWIALLKTSRVYRSTKTRPSNKPSTHSSLEMTVIRDGFGCFGADGVG